MSEGGDGHGDGQLRASRLTLSNRPRSIIENQLFRRQRSLNLGSLQKQGAVRSEDEHFDKTYVVIIFSEKARLQKCQDVVKIIQELGVHTTLEVVSKSEKYLYLTASTNKLLRFADEAELEKMTITGSMQKFSYASISDFLLKDMTPADIIRDCEAPVLIKDVVKPAIIVADWFNFADLFLLVDFYANAFRFDCKFKINRRPPTGKKHSAFAQIEKLCVFVNT